MKKFAVALCLLMSMCAVSLMATPGQVIIIRNAERNAEGNLSQKGFERAGALAAYFVLSPDLLNFGEPVAIFAARPTLNTPPFHPHDNTERCIHTIRPTADALLQPVHPGFGKFEEAALAELILTNPLYEGQNVVICWHRQTIQDLAIALGYAAAPVFPDEFDVTWVLQFSPTVTLTQLNQALLFGDTP